MKVTQKKNETLIISYKTNEIFEYLHLNRYRKAGHLPADIQKCKFKNPSERFIWFLTETL